MNANPFGLDISTTTIKAVWLSHDKNTYKLNAVSSYPTPPGGMTSESPFDHEQVAKTIRKVVSEGKIGTNLVNIALPENQVYTKVIEMPALSDRELSSAIYWEAEQYIPVSLSEVMFDYKILRRPEKQEGGTMDVLLVASPIKLLDKYQKVISLAGLTIFSVETEILSTIRSLALDNSFPVSLIVNIRSVSTSIAIVRKGVLVFVYFTQVGGITISRAIAEDFGFTVSQAEEYKKTYGVYGKNLGGKIGKASEPILMSIVSEIRKATAYYNEKYKADDPIQRIILSGESAKLPGIDLFFAQNCGIESVIANPWKVLGNQQVAQQLLENAPEYTVTMGLAMRDSV